ncbi:MAG: hypothetical protein EA356_17840 [Geminicoccaceae bacterium]|nr:MAG: hypothetical protein EA356_17840 [Geminicoccaceae bacterium]
MDRTQLRVLLTAGPSRNLNVLETTLRLEHEANADERMFRVAFLNRCIILKHLDHRAHGRATAARVGVERPTQTLLYLPYDANRPHDGGEAIVYTRDNLRRLFEARTHASSAFNDNLVEDETTLDLLDTLPALNPFLLRDAFARAARPLPEAYLALDPKVMHRIKRRLLGRIRPLVVAAFGTDDATSIEKLEGVIDSLLMPGVTCSELQELGAALRIDPDVAPEVLGAWAGIAFYEDELERLRPAIHLFAHWLVHEAWPQEPIGGERAQAMRRRLDHLRSAVRGAWRDIRLILDEYRDTYIAMVFEDRPGPFVAFLRNCRHQYWRIGDLFGRFEQAVSAWQVFRVPFDDGAIPLNLFEEFLFFLERTFSSEPLRNRLPSKNKRRAVRPAMA